MNVPLRYVSLILNTVNSNMKWTKQGPGFYMNAKDLGFFSSFIDQVSFCFKTHKTLKGHI